MREYRKYISMASAMLALAATSETVHSQITYTFKQGALPGDANVLSGFITTTGTGTFSSASNITAWGFSISSSPTQTFDVTGSGAGAGVTLAGNATLTATSSTLTLTTPYGMGTASEFYLQGTGGYLEWNVPPEGSNNAYVDARDSVSGISPSFFELSYSSPLEIGSTASVPEPSSMLLTLAAMVGGYGWRWTRRRKATDQPNDN